MKLTEEQSKIAEFNQKYKTDVVIYFDNFYYPYDSYNDTKSTDFYDYNDFGINFDKYSGILKSFKHCSIFLANPPEYGISSHTA